MGSQSLDLPSNLYDIAIGSGGQKWFSGSKWVQSITTMGEQYSLTTDSKKFLIVRVKHPDQRDKNKENREFGVYVKYSIHRALETDYLIFRGDNANKLYEEISGKSLK